MAPDDRIRVVHVLCALESGGAERLVLDLCRFADHGRFQVAVATVMGGGPLEAAFLEAGIPLMLGGRRPRTAGIDAGVRLRRFYRDFGADVVHTHLFAGDTWGRLAALGPRRPVLISTEHNLNLEESARHRLAKRALAPLADRIVAVSEAVRARAMALEGAPAERLEVIPNGIDLRRFPPARAGDPGPGHRLLAVGRLVPQKGIDVLLEALPAAPGMTLTVVGDGPMRCGLERRARALRIDDRVRFAGLQGDVGPWLREADILVHPARWEGFGLSVLEAMATGLPVIASRVGGLVDLVRPGVTGLLVPAGAPLELAAALRELAADPEARCAYGRAGAALAHGSYGIDAVARRYEALYARCLAARR